MIAKILITVAIFLDPLIYELSAAKEGQKKDFQDILEETIHELNSPLSSMGINLPILAKGDTSKGQKYTQLESDYEKIHVIMLKAQEDFKNIPGSDVTNEKIQKGKKGKVQKEIINLNKMVHKSSMDVKEGFRRMNVNFDIKYGRSVQAIGIETDIYQILVNIIKNAIEAYDEASEVRPVIIKTGYRNRNESQKSIPFVDITDYADGIRTEDLERIWEKGVSLNKKKDKIVHGQGLSVVSSKAAENDVDVLVNSVHKDAETAYKKKGTTFTLYFKEE